MLAPLTRESPLTSVSATPVRLAIIEQARRSKDCDSPADTALSTNRPPGDDPHGVDLVPCVLCGDQSSVLTASGPYCSPHAVANIHKTLMIVNRSIGKVTP